MKRTFKKAVCVFLVVAMLLCAAPLNGFVGLELPNLFDFRVQAASSGTCGDNLTWTYESGVLTISGTGAMTDWDYHKDQEAPWYFNGVTSVVIEDGVTTIGNYAFYYCTSLTSITIPDGITTIGDYAFDYCNNLISITIPDSVTTIGNSAFLNCSKLTSLPIGNGVTTIGDEAFASCYDLTDVTIPNSVTTIGRRVFTGCYLTSIKIGSGVSTIGEGAFAGCRELEKITVDADNQYFCVDSDGVLYSKDMTRLLQYPTASTRPSYTVPDGVTAIDNEAFSLCHGITNLTLPDSLKTLGEYVFFECYNLHSVTMPAGMESIGDYAFGFSTKPYFNGTLEQWEKVETDPNDTSTLSKIILCGDTDRPYYIPGTCGTNLNWILYADGELVISGSGAMTNWSSSSNAPWRSMESSIRSITISEGVTSVGSYAFYDCEEITNVTIPESVTSIGGYAFTYCYGITELTMPVSAKIPQGNAFYGCHSIEKLTLTKGTGIMQNYGTNSYSGATNTYYQNTPWFESRARLNEIVIEDGVTSIGNYAFYEAYGAESVRIPASVTTIGNSAFKSTYSDLTDVYYSSAMEDWNKISIGSENTSLDTAAIHTATVSGTCGDNLTWRFYADTGRLSISGTGAMTDWTTANQTPWYAYRESITEIIIDEGVTSIGKYAFFNCTGEKSVTIPNSVIFIGMNAFSNAPRVTDVYYASDRYDWAKITVNAGNNAFSYATHHYVSHFVDSGYFDEFYEWELYSDGTLTIVGEGGMSNRVSADAYPWYQHKDKITSVVIDYDPNLPEPIKVIGNHAFEGYTNLTTVEFYSDITRIGNYAFAGCTSLESFIIPDTVKDIGDSAFNGCSGLKELTMPISAKIYNSGNVFSGCTNIKKITLTKGNGTMVNYGIDTIVTSDTVFYKYAPWYISGSNLKELIIEEGITAISSYAFYGCTGITSITIPDGVTSIGDYAFCNGASLKDVIIPDSVTSIGEYAFYYCSALENVYYAGDVAGWCNISFADAYATPMSYAGNLYFGGELVTEVYIPGTVTSIGDYVFYGCSNITAFRYEGTAEQWSGVVIGKGNDILLERFEGGGSDNPFYATGKCGDTLSWILYENGELVISGMGGMSNRISAEAYPWHEYRDKITSVNLSESLTVIGNYAFYNCTALESVTIPDSVSVVGSYAFYGCTGLKELSVPISARVTTSPCYTYNNCTNIEKITITKGNGTSFDYNLSTSEPYKYYAYTPWYVSGCGTVVIEDGITSIGNYMFYRCTTLTDITIPDSVEKIGNGAFYYCVGLKELAMPVSAKIYNSADTFLNCINIKKITLTKGNGNAQDYTASSYGAESTYYQYTPWYTSQCRTIVIDKDVTSVGYNTFYGCNNIVDVYCTGDIVDWCKINFDDRYANPIHSGDNLYFDDELVKEITIPTTLTKIGSYAFYTCSYLTAAYFNGTPEQWRAIDVGMGNDALTDMMTFTSGDRLYYTPGTCGADLNWILYTDGELEIMGTGDMNVWVSTTNVPWYKYKDKITSVKISDGVTSIGGYAFYGCLNVLSINLPDSITTIGSNAFFACMGLTSVTLGKNITSIGKAAFGSCLKLVSARCAMTYDEWAKVAVQSDNQCLTDVLLLGADSDRLYFAAGDIGENITWYLYADNELSFVGEGDMANYTAITTAPWYDRRDKIKTVVISDGITSVGKNTFAECENINNVYVYGYDVSIANGVFNDCDDVNINCFSGSSAHAYAKRNNLAYTMLDGDSVGFTVMNGMVIAYNGNAATPVIPVGVTAIGSYAFMNNSTITSIVLPNTVTDIYTGAFAGCENLERIVIPESVTTIASTAFNGTDVVFACVENSYAHIYAVEHGIICELTSPQKGIELTSHNKYITVNGTTQLSVVVTSGNKSVIWSSSDSSVASVDSNGFVTGKKAGIVVITATTSDGIYKDYCLVRVVGITGSYTTNTVVDPESGCIYGLDVGLDSLSDYIELIDNSCTLEYDTLTDEIGTGTITNVVRDGEIIDSYTVVIFGDVDGNGWYDANDAFIVNMIASGLIDESVLSEAMRKAADCNHDGAINELDFNLLIDASVLLDNVDQSATQPELVSNAVYIQYCSMIDQSAGADSEPVPTPDEEISDQETNQSVDTVNIEAIFATILEYIIKIFAFVFSLIK